MSEHVIVTGASGLVGQAAMKHFADRGVPVTAVSRRPPVETHGATFVPLDLTDADTTAEFMAAQTDATRLVFAALFEKPGLVAGWREADQIATNDAMLRNTLEPLLSSAKNLAHISILQGTKAYGAHVHPIDIPAREDRSEDKSIPNFYWEQEDYLRARAGAAGIPWTIFRPQIVFGMAIGAAMNLIPAIGAYGALMKAQAKPLGFPGGAVSPILEAVDADLLAAAIAWAGGEARTGAAANTIFNVTNGDVFVWRNVWPAIADALGMPAGPDTPMRLGEEMPGHAPAWRALAERHGLREPDLAALGGESFHYADFTMAYGADQPIPSALVSTIRLRQSGFTQVIDTEAMFRKHIAAFQEKRLLPPRDA